jgi:hypothetical protein
MSYRVFFNFASGLTKDLLGKKFYTRGEAYLAAMEASSDYSAGEEVLRLSGEDFVEDPIVNWKIIETKN